EAVLPDLPVVPLRAPGDAAREALLEGGGARRVVAAQADRHDADAPRIDVRARCQPLPGRCSVALGIVPQVLVPEAHAFAVAGAIHDQAGDAARHEVGHALEILDL